MSLFNFFKKPAAPLMVGETRSDKIGCYLLGVESPDGSNPSYHSLAINREELLEDCLDFFSKMASRKKELVEQGTLTSPLHAQDLKVILNAIENMPMFIDMHLKQDVERPFFNFPGIRIFLRTGERPRQMLKGKYIE